MSTVKSRSCRLKTQLLSLVLVAFMSINIAYAESEEKRSPTDTTVDSILGAMADMTLDQAKKIINLKFTRDIREKACGYHPYTTNSSRNVKDDINQLFPETCEYVKKKIERNIFSDKLIDAFKEDMVMNGILLVNNDDDGIRELINKRVRLKKENDAYQEELLAGTFIYLTWKEVPIKESILQALSENDKYREYATHIEKALDVADELKNIKNIIKKSIDTKIVSGQLKLEYKLLPFSGEKLDGRNILITQVPAGTNAEILSNVFKMSLATDVESQKRFGRQLIVLLLKERACNANCIESINKLLDKNPSDLFSTLTKIALNNKAEGSDFDHSNLENYKALGVLNSLSELSNVHDKDTARAILDKYLADENTRTARYWDMSLTLGTLLGAATGGAHCSDCNEKDYYLTPNLYMPFGLFFTYGKIGMQFHVFDLGQYTNINEQENEGGSNSFKDAVAPGLAIFGRLRRYPASFGLDYTYKPERSNKTFSEHQIKAFIAMDIQLFKLN